MHPARWTIAAVSYLAESDSSDAIFWTCIVLLLVFVGMGLVWWVKRRLAPDEDFHGEVFSLGHLGKLQKPGQMPDGEYGRARGVILGSFGVPPVKPDEPEIKPDIRPGPSRPGPGR